MRFSRRRRFTQHILAVKSLKSTHHVVHCSRIKVHLVVLLQRGQSQVRLDNSELGEQGLGLLVGDRWVDNDVVTRHPVDRGGDSVLVTGLQGVQHSQDLGSVSTSRSGVSQDQSDLLGGVDDEHRSDGELHTLVVDIGGVLVVDHVVQVSNLSLRVGDNGELQGGASDLINVLDPSLVRLGAIGRQANELGVSLLKLRLQLGESTQLGGADGGEVVGVREQDGPLVANEVVERDRTVGGLGLEVRGGGAQSQGTLRSSVSHCEYFLDSAI